jgi:hypothetical protein
VSRQFNTSELVHHGPLLKLCSANTWSKLSLSGYWESRTFYIHEDKTIFNVNTSNQLRGKWSLENARILSIPPEWQPWQSKYNERGFMIEFTKPLKQDHHHHGHHDNSPSNSMSHADHVVPAQLVLPTIPDVNKAELNVEHEEEGTFPTVDQERESVDLTETVTEELAPCTNHGSDPVNVSTHRKSHRPESAIVIDEACQDEECDACSAKSTGGLLTHSEPPGNHNRSGTMKPAPFIDQIICYAKTKEQCDDWKSILQLVIDHNPHNEDNHLQFLYHQYLFRIADVLQFAFKSRMKLVVVHEQLNEGDASEPTVLTALEHILGRNRDNGGKERGRSLQRNDPHQHHRNTNDHSHRDSHSHHSQSHDHSHSSHGNSHSRRHHHHHNRVKRCIERMLSHSVLQHEKGGTLRYIVEKTLNSLYVTLNQMVEEDPEEFLPLLHHRFHSQEIHLKIVGDLDANHNNFYLTDDEDAEGGSVSRSRRSSSKEGHRRISHGSSLHCASSLEHTSHDDQHKHHDHNHHGLSNVIHPQDGLGVSSGSQNHSSHNHNHAHHLVVSVSDTSAHRPYYRTSFTEHGHLLIEVLRIDHHLSNCGYDLPSSLICKDGLPYLVHKSIRLNLAKRDSQLLRLTKLLGGTEVSKGPKGTMITRVNGKIFTLECEMKSNYEALVKHNISPGKFGFLFYDQLLEGLCENIMKDQIHDDTVGHLIGSYCKNRRVIVQPYNTPSVEHEKNHIKSKEFLSAFNFHSSHENQDHGHKFIGTMKSACTFTSEGNLLIEYSDPSSFESHQIGLDIVSRLTVGELPYSVWLTVYKENAHKDEKLKQLREMTEKPSLTFDMDLVKNYKACVEMGIANVRFGSLFVTVVLNQLEKALKPFYCKFLSVGIVGKVTSELNTIFRGNRIILRPMEYNPITRNNNSLYKFSFTELEGNLLIEYEKSNLVTFDCASVFAEQLNCLFKIDGKAFHDGIAARVAAIVQNVTMI